MKVGIFVTIALIFLAALILQQSWGIDWFSDNQKVLTYLPDVGGLKPGNPVWLAGIEVGKVRKVTIVSPEVYTGNAPVFKRIEELRKKMQELDPNLPNYKNFVADIQDKIRDSKLELRFVEVQMDIRSQYLNRMSVDSEVSIGSKGLIGDSFLEISAGTYGVLPRKSGDFYVIEGVRTTGFREIMTGANDVIANFGVLSEQFKNIANKINPEKVGSDLGGTVQDLQTTLHEATTTFSEATVLIKDLRQGEGSIGRMVSDPAFYKKLTDSLEKLNGLADQVQNGSGTLAKLIKDPKLYDSSTATLKKADVMMDRIERGDGTLGRLSKDPALYDSSRLAMEKLAGFVEQIDKGEGTLGKLVKDPTLYNNLNQSTAEITKLIYDLRQDPKKYLTIRFRLF